MNLKHFKYFIDEGIDVEIINEHGPTEATVGCSIYSFNSLSDNEKIKQSIPIGTPIDNAQLYILDENNALAPVGIPGELCIGGRGLARGYVNRNERTQEKFIKNPFNGKDESKLYKTGDVARWLNDGTVEYLGRKDDQ